MTDEILEKMKRGVYYPGSHLGRKNELETMVEKGYLEQMDGTFLCGPDSPPKAENFSLVASSYLAEPSL